MARLERPAPVAMTAADVPGGGQRPLDDAMLAMDVADTLAHKEHLVSPGLAGEVRDRALIERLRHIYATQGIAVPDSVLADGVAAVREGRFTYRPPPDTWATAWIRIYVERGRWARRVALVLAVALAVLGTHHLAVVAPRAALVAGLERDEGAILALAPALEVVLAADAYADRGRAAAAVGDWAAVRSAGGALAALRSRLEVEYDLLIVNEPGRTSGVWRGTDVNPSARNFYLIVEAVDPAGRHVRTEVVNEETGVAAQVSTFGLRVDQETFERVRADKLADGVVDDRLVGTKRPGELEPTYLVPTTGGVITSW